MLIVPLLDKTVLLTDKVNFKPSKPSGFSVYHVLSH